jgi:lipooligosaccharide transport system permease protein
MLEELRETLGLCLHLTRRNWIVYKKDFLANIAPTAFEPIFLILSLGVGLGYFVAQIDGRSYIAYIAPGLAVSTALFTAFFESSYGFYVRMTFENIFKAMLTTPIGVREVIFGEFLWVGLKGAVMFTLLSLGLAGFGLVTRPSLLLLAPFVGALVALPCGSLGLLATSFVRNINQFQTVYAFFISPLFYFSGIFFPLKQMPPGLRQMAEFLPLSHGVALSQAIFWNERPLHAFLVHGGALVLFSMFFCAWAYYRIQRKLQS